ncbi:MAG: hypothetical protein COT18_03575 [Elusimicrobia bacterium CG08_land_8_20_14_0_20_59_10]|nr:MAG: hypothetical protein COT18_03575 [Elusimicrobia bacterium CG08_land_8_20_14_0_20_59_10]
MMVIVRIQSQGKSASLWNEIINKKDKLQDILGDNGTLLYLSKRLGSNDISLMLHTTNSLALADFITSHLAKISGVDGLWLINMLKPVFFQLPAQADRMKRYAVSVKIYPPRLDEVYRTVSKTALPAGINMVYLAYTCHLFGDCLQFSVLADKDAKFENFVENMINKIPGVLRATATEIEKTHVFIPYREWERYL